MGHRITQSIGSRATLRSWKRVLPSVGFATTMLAAACSDGPVAPNAPATEAAAELRDGAIPVSLSVSTTSMTDPFDIWDATLWSKGNHALGRGYLSAANVSVNSGHLELNTPAGTFNGGEVLTTYQYGHGTFTALARCATPYGTLCAFFLYQGARNKNDEIDIEVLAGTQTVYFTTWVRGSQTNSVAVNLGFDPAAAYHAYTIVYGSAAVDFLVDGRVLAHFVRRLPTRAMYLMANAWWPTWTSGGASTGGTYYIDQVSAAL